MSQKHSFPLQIAELHQSTSDWSIYVPLLHPQVTEVETSPSSLARRFRREFETEVLEEGNYRTLLTSLLQQRPEQKTVSVRLRAADDGFQYPELDLHFQAFQVNLSSGSYLGFVPALGVEATAGSPDALETQLVENIRLEFVRNERLGSARSLLETQWFEDASFHRQHVSLEFYTPSELRELQQKEEQLLPEAASKLTSNPAPAFKLDDSIQELATALGGSRPSSVLVVGPSGVGKSALIRNFWARHEAEADLWETSATKLISTLTGREGWQQNLTRLCGELRESGDYLYVRNLADLFEVGQHESNQTSLAEHLRSYVDRGRIVLISECTGAGAEQVEAQHPGYIPLFRQVRLQEPDRETLRSIVFRRAEQAADAHGALISRDATDTLVRLQKRYSPYSGFPGKSVQDIEAIIRHESAAQDTTPEISRGRVLDYYTEATGFPRFMIDPEVPLEVSEIEEHFHSRIFGQDTATRTVIDLMAAVKTRLIRANKPIASLLFAGPTGVGKTEMAKVLASFMFDGRDQMIRFDMSEYSDRQSVLQLTGEAETRGSGLLTSAARKNPFSVLLLDEVEKAHPLFADLLLQMLDAGRLTDANGQMADFCSMIIVMTSNIGTEQQSEGTVGFREDRDGSQALIDHYEQAVEQHFRPELFNRIDRVVPFTPLTREAISQIVHRELKHVRSRNGLAAREVDLSVSDEALALLRRQGYDETYGARHLQRTIHDQLVVPIARSLIQYQADTPLSADITASEEELEINVDGLQAEESRATQEDSRDLARRVANWRRVAQSIEQGRYFTSLTSRHHRHQREHRKLVKRRNRGTASERVHQKIGEMEKSLSATTDLLETLRETFEELSELERSVTSQILTRDPTGDPADDFDSEEKRLQDCWTELVQSVRGLHDLLNSEDRTCVLAVYGRPYALVDVLAEFYVDTAQESDLDCMPHRVRLEHDESFRAERRSSTDFNPEATYVGAEIELEGPAAFLLFGNPWGGDESGLHRRLDEDEDLMVMVQRGSLSEYAQDQRPENIHRKSFFEGREVTRTYSSEKSDRSRESEMVYDPNDLALLRKNIRYRFIRDLFSRAVGPLRQISLEDVLTWDLLQDAGLL